MAQAIRVETDNNDAFEPAAMTVTRSAVEGYYAFEIEQNGLHSLAILDEDTARDFAISILRWTGKHMTIHNVPEQNEASVPEQTEV